MWWRAGYPIQFETRERHGFSTRTAHVELDEIRSAECPKSVALRDSRAGDLVRILRSAESVGGTPLGDPARWPGWFFDAVKIFKEETKRDERAQERAISRA